MHCGLAVAGLLAPSAHTQVLYGSIVGGIEDQSGSVVLKPSVIINVAINVVARKDIRLIGIRPVFLAIRGRPASFQQTREAGL